MAQAFHFLMLLFIGAITFISAHGYRQDPGEPKTALKWNIAFAVWFFYLFIAAPGARMDGSDFLWSGLLIQGLALLINARRLYFGGEYLFVRHPAERSISSALKGGAPIDPSTAAGWMHTTGEADGLLFAGLRARQNKRKAEQARALREKLQADAELAEAIVWRERARAEAKAIEEDASQAWRKVLSIRPGKVR